MEQHSDTGRGYPALPALSFPSSTSCHKLLPLNPHPQPRPSASTPGSLGAFSNKDNWGSWLAAPPSPVE